MVFLLLCREKGGKCGLILLSMKHQLERGRSGRDSTNNESLFIETIEHICFVLFYLVLFYLGKIIFENVSTYAFVFVSSLILNCFGVMTAYSCFIFGPLFDRKSNYRKKEI